MSETTVITSRIPSELNASLERLAGEIDRSRAWIIATAVERYVREELEFVEFVQEGEADIAAGRVHSHEEVMRSLGVEKGKSRAA